MINPQLFVTTKVSIVYKLIVLLVLLLLPVCAVQGVFADDICFIGTATPMVGQPGYPIAASAANQPIVDEATALQSAFNVSLPLYESPNTDDFSDKLGNVYIGKPVVDYLESQNGSDITANGVGLLVAHEYAHQFQFKIWASGHDRQPSSIKVVELQADFIAGAWLGINNRQILAALRRQVGPSFDRQIGIDDLTDKNTHAAEEAYNFLGWTPALHGTIEQRTAAIKAGIQYGEDFYAGLPSIAFIGSANQIYDDSKSAVEAIARN